MSNIQKNIISTLSATSQAILEDFQKYQSEITCTKCTKKGNLIYTGNSNAKVPQPQFSCKDCKKSLFLSSVEREIKQAKACGIAIIKPTTTQTPSKKRTRANSSCSDDQQQPSTSTAKTVKITKNIQKNNSTVELSALLDLVKSLQDRLVKMEKDNSDIKNQLQLCNNKNAQLEKQLTQQSKNSMLRTLQQQQHHSTSIHENADDTAMEEVEFPAISTSNKGKEKEGATQGIAASKYASSTTATYASTTSKNIKPKNTKKLEKLLKNDKKTPATNPNRIASAVRAFSTPSNEPQEYVYTYYPAKSRTVLLRTGSQK
ncbi:unnamed protein product [Mucor hiemalis]